MLKVLCLLGNLQPYRSPKWRLQGLRVVGLATKMFTKLLLRVEREDEAGMLFRGFLAFLDPPKESAIPCIKTLYDRGVSIKASARISALMHGVLVRLLIKAEKDTISALWDCELFEYIKTSPPASRHSTSGAPVPRQAFKCQHSSVWEIVVKHAVPAKRSKVHLQTSCRFSLPRS